MLFTKKRNNYKNNHISRKAGKNKKLLTEGMLSLSILIIGKRH